MRPSAAISAVKELSVSAFFSGNNDHNFFEIAHTVKRLYEMGSNNPNGFKLYNFVDNHDVERIYTKLSNKAHFTPVHILLYTLSW